MKFVLSVQAGLESLAKKELQKIGANITRVQDRLVFFEGDALTCLRANLRSRVGNKVYIMLANEKNIVDFDAYFDALASVDLKKYFKKNHPFTVKTVSERSQLFAAKTLQTTGKKALATALAGADIFYREDTNEAQLTILVMLIDDELFVLLDTSGDGLHKRGYRLEAGEAPIKENLAAGLVLLSGWRFAEPFYDPFCGSGTIAIEALMIAKNIAPGLQRDFAFLDLGLVTEEQFRAEKEEAKKSIYEKRYDIVASDSDEEVLSIARENAKNAGLGGEIRFEKKYFSEYLDTPLSGTLVSNPPYGGRMQPENIVSLYNSIDKLFRLNEHLGGGIISSFMEFDELVQAKNYKKRKLYNGGEKCYFWKRK